MSCVSVNIFRDQELEIFQASQFEKKNLLRIFNPFRWIIVFNLYYSSVYKFTLNDRTGPITVVSILIYELSVKLYYLLTHCALHYSVYYTVRARYESLLHSNFLEMYLTVHHSIFLEMYFKLQLLVRNNGQFSLWTSAWHTYVNTSNTWFQRRNLKQSKKYWISWYC